MTQTVHAANIDQILGQIHQAPQEELAGKAIPRPSDLDANDMDELLDHMEDIHLIELEDGIYRLTEKGYEIIEAGGYAHLKKKRAQPELIPDFGSKMMQQLEDMMADEPNRKENFKKIKRTTFAWLFGLTLVGMFLAYLASR